MLITHVIFITLPEFDVTERQAEKLYVCRTIFILQTRRKVKRQHLNVGREEEVKAARLVRADKSEKLLFSLIL